jgi:hypothetical protein
LISCNSFNDFSISFWANKPSNNVSAMIARDATTIYCPWILGFGTGPTGQCLVYMSSDEASWDIAAGKTLGTLTYGVWTHLVITRNGSTFTPYQDGVQADTWTSAAAFPANSNALSFCRVQDTLYDPSALDDVRIYNRALTLAEIENLYNDNTGTEADNIGTEGDGIVGLGPASLEVYSEGTVKVQGSYSLKGTAVATDSLNKTLTNTPASNHDLTGVNKLRLSMYASRTGSNIKIGLHDSGGTTTEITPNIAEVDTWQTIEWDISGVSDANKNNIDLEAVKTDIQKYGDNDKLDEDWEQIIYGACQNDVYLKSKVFNILELFNYLRNNFKDRIDDLEEKIIMALKFASITNVDDDVNLKGVIEKRGNKTVFSDIKTKVETIKQELITNGAKKEGLEIKLKTYQNLFDTFLSFSEETGKKHEIMSSSIRFDFGYLNNPPKNTELVGIELVRVKDYSNLPKGLIFVAVKDKEKQKVAFKVSKELNTSELKDFLSLNYK